MKIEKVMLKKHLKAGPREYTVGIYSDPIPEDILGELHRRDVVEILEQSESQPPLPPVSASKKSVWDKTSEKKPGPKKPPKEKAPLRRARRTGA